MPQTNRKRHVARIVNTDQRCVVAFMQIPGREDHALVIPTDTLSPRMEQAVMEIVESPEGQNEETLANVLGRRLLPETGKSVLETLHEMRLLVPAPVDTINMMPMPNMPFPLKDVLRAMGRAPYATEAGVAAAPIYHNQHEVNTQSLKVEERQMIARNLIVEAELLESEARKKRERAYAHAPELDPARRKPVATAKPAAATDEVEMALVATVKPKRTRAKRPTGSKSSAKTA